jgi:phage gp46-like protein
MTDIRLKEYSSLLTGVAMDWLMQPTGLIDETEELATAVRVALGTDRLANTTEVLPDPDSTDRRGWWGDLDAKEIWDGWPIGCKNWLLSRAKISNEFSWEGATLQRARAYTREALQPLITRRIATRVDVSAERVDKQKIVVNVMVFRGPKRAIELRFAFLWDQVVDR